MAQIFKAKIMNEIKNNITGLILCVAIFAAAYLTSNLISTILSGNQNSPIPTVIFAVLIGILTKNILKPHARFEPGISFAQKNILRLGIIFLGIRISLSDVLAYGALSIPLVIICILTVLSVIKLTSQRLKISSEMTYLIAIGTSICGASAIIALAPVINAKKGEITYAVANIVLFGLIGMFCYPYLAETLFDGNQKAIGLFLGTAIHDTAQVTASGLIYEQQFASSTTLEVATITKLVRNSFLLLLIPIFAFAYMKDNQGENYSLRGIFPFFVLGFIFLVTCRTAGDELIARGFFMISESHWQYVISLVKTGSSICLGIAMASLGLSTDLSELNAVGYKPFLVGFLAATAVAVSSFMVISFYVDFQYLT